MLPVYVVSFIGYVVTAGKSIRDKVYKTKGLSGNEMSVLLSRNGEGIRAIGNVYFMDRKEAQNIFATQKQ